MAGAAIFDLDRTLLQGGTGPLLSRAMYDLGVVTRKLPGEGLLYGMFDLIGETLPSIFLARQATLLAKGRDGATFDAAAQAAAETIAAVIHPFALSLIEQHHAAGRPVVLATTTPHHLIKPLADKLGFDHVIATRYTIDDEGRFDGSISGNFVWSRGKLAAVKEWAAREDVDLAESFAYSDSIYDLPLLSAVGSPAAVNPDPRLTVYAVARGWPIVHFDVSPGVLKVPVLGIELQRLLFLASPPLLTPYARFDIAGTEHIPRTGPAILVGNHRSYFDLQTIIQLLRATGRTARGLGKKEIFDVPVHRRDRDGAGRHPRRPGERGPGVVRARGRGARGRRAGLPAAAGHDPARGEVLRPGAQGPHRRRPARGDDRRTRHPVRHVGHRGRLAPVRAGAPDVQPHRPADGARAGRPTGRAQAALRRGRHPSDHGGDHRLPAPAGPRAPRADGGGDPAGHPGPVTVRSAGRTGI